MSFGVWLSMVGVFFSGGLLPGPAVMLVLSSAFRYRFGPAMLAALGVATANVFWLLLAISGAAALAKQFPKAFVAMKILGVLVIIYLAIKSMTGPLPDMEGANEAPPKGRLFLSGFLLQVSSPLPLVYFGLILPTFIDLDGNIWLQFWIMLATVTATELIGLGVYAYGAQTIRQKLRDPAMAKRFNILIGIVMIASGLWAILSTA